MGSVICKDWKLDPTKLVDWKIYDNQENGPKTS